MARIKVILENFEEEMAANFEALWEVMPKEKKYDFASIAMEASVLNQQYTEQGGMFTGDVFTGFRAADLKLSFERLRREKKV